MKLSKICHSLEISYSKEHSRYYGIGFQLNQKSVDIWPIPFQSGDPVDAQLDNTCKIVVELQSMCLLHYVVYQISKGKSSNPFNLLICLKQNRCGELILLIMVNEFYVLVWIKMKLNWKYNWTVSLMETKTSAKSAIKVA